jgi:hypothetical protein
MNTIHNSSSTHGRAVRRARIRRVVRRKERGPLNECVELPRQDKESYKKYDVLLLFTLYIIISCDYTVNTKESRMISQFE